MKGRWAWAISSTKKKKKTQATEKARKICVICRKSLEDGIQDKQNI